GDRARELDEAAGVIAPDAAEGRLQVELHRAVARRVEAVLGPRDMERRGRRLRRRRRQRELLRRGAADVPLLMEAVDDDRSDRAGEEHGDRGEDDDQAPHDGGSGYPACTIVPSGMVEVSPAEFVARSVASQVPGGTASVAV